MIELDGKMYNEYTIFNGYYRYEKVRKLNPQQFTQIWTECLKEKIHFDDYIDSWPKKPIKFK